MHYALKIIISAFLILAGMLTGYFLMTLIMKIK